MDDVDLGSLVDLSRCKKVLMNCLGTDIEGKDIDVIWTQAYEKKKKNTNPAYDVSKAMVLQNSLRIVSQITNQNPSKVEY